LFIFNNDGYLMIKHTQKSLFNGRYSGTEPNSGISCPDYKNIALAFNINYTSIRTWEDFNRNINSALDSPDAYIIEIFMDPEQPLVPKLSLALQEDGTIISPPLEDLSPILKREEFKKNMLIDIHPKSNKLL
jgi:acetolactate synthase-1/2/3 large subunit